MENRWQIEGEAGQGGGKGDQTKVLLNPSCCSRCRSRRQKVKLSLNAAQLISFEAAFLAAAAAAAAVIAVGHKTATIFPLNFHFFLTRFSFLRLLLRARQKKSKKNESNKRIYELRKTFGLALAGK